MKIPTFCFCLFLIDFYIYTLAFLVRKLDAADAKKNLNK